MAGAGKVVRSISGFIDGLFDRDDVFKKIAPSTWKLSAKCK
jgi:hypothetical protein